jgi:hypothetical protein
MLAFGVCTKYINSPNKCTGNVFPLVRTIHCTHTKGLVVYHVSKIFNY